MNFRKENINLKCANDSLCKFEGVGTYEGNINGIAIRLENVLYSNQVNKNLLSGIKLTKNGMKYILRSRNDKVYLSLKTKTRQNKTINLGTYEANKNNII